MGGRSCRRRGTVGTQGCFAETTKRGELGFQGCVLRTKSLVFLLKNAVFLDKTSGEACGNQALRTFFRDGLRENSDLEVRVGEALLKLSSDRGGGVGYALGVASLVGGVAPISR